MWRHSKYALAYTGNRLAVPLDFVSVLETHTECKPESQWRVRELSYKKEVIERALSNPRMIGVDYFITKH